MNEIEKMYKNAGFIRKQCKDYSCIVCEQYKTCEKYPPFTAEKQIELIEWIMGKYNEVFFSKRGSGYNICIDDGSFIGCHHNDRTFERCLAGDINLLWQDLIEEEKQQVKGILE